MPVAVVNLPGDVQAISLGGYHSCALVDGGVWCWGDGNNGQLGLGNDNNSYLPVEIPTLATGVQAIAANGFHTCALVDGGAQCWGYNSNGQLGDGDTQGTSQPAAVLGLGGGVDLIANGLEENTCALVDGSVWCWGSGGYGEVGNGSFSDSAVPQQVVFP